MEPKKRPYTEDAAPISHKKRMLSSASPQLPTTANGSVEHHNEPISGDSLERFRKEAIFRKMKYYSRENERSQSRIAELERRKSTCEAGLAAMTACWTQLLETISLLANPDELPPLDPQIRESLTFPRVQDEDQDEFTQALDRKRNATVDVVTRFLQLGGNPREEALKDRSLTQCQAMQTECAALRSQVELMNHQLNESKELNEDLLTQLAAAESRADRAQSATITALSQSAIPRATSSMEPDGESQSQLEPSPPPTNGTTKNEETLNAWQGLARTRSREIEQLNGELKIAQHRLVEAQKALAVSVASPAFSMYNTLLQHVNHLEATVQNQIVTIQQHASELEVARRERDDCKAAVTVHSDSIQELRTTVAKRDFENARVREERDRAKGELKLAERKIADLVKQQATEELRVLAESRLERINILKDETVRLRTRLASHANDKDFLSFILNTPLEEDGVKYMNHLKERLQTAERRIDSLEATLSQYQSQSPDPSRQLSTEVSLRSQLSAANQSLDHFYALYKDATTDGLKVLEEEVTRLRLVESQHAQSETSLYTELDKLSAAWEALDKKVDSKILDLAVAEERAVKAGVDKAKLETKYYASIKDRDSIDNERKSLQRLVEKQLKLMEKYKEQETSTEAQLRDYQTQVDKLQQVVDSAELRVKSYRLDLEISRRETEALHEKYNKTVQYEGPFKRAEQLVNDLEAQKKEFFEKRHQLDEEQVAFLEEKERLVNDRKVHADALEKAEKFAKGAGREDELGMLYKIINCSTCHQRPRSHQITKCCHTFCQVCLDDRLKNRLRKCPSCNIQFAAQDVQPIFFQG